MKSTRIVIVSLGISISSIISYFFFDRMIALFFKAHKDFWFVQMNQSITHLGTSGWILAISLLLYIFFKKREKTVALQAFFVFSSIALSGILVNILKTIFSRYRPKAYFQDNLFGFDIFAFKMEYVFNSFPSGHSATAMGLAVALMVLFPKYRVWTFLFGVIVASSRFIITAHYFSDVLIGGLLGAIVSYSLYHFYFQKRIESHRCAN